MKKHVFMEKYPIFELELNKSETNYATTADIMTYLKAQIQAHPIAVQIGEFDHMTHTKNIQGEVDDNMLAAQHVIFCFGTKLPNPQVMAVRPRSIGVVEYADKFVISFMEPPMPIATEAMTNWVLALKTA